MTGCDLCSWYSPFPQLADFQVGDNDAASNRGRSLNLGPASRIQSMTGCYLSSWYSPFPWFVGFQAGDNDTVPAGEDTALPLVTTTCPSCGQSKHRPVRLGSAPRYTPRSTHDASSGFPSCAAAFVMGELSGPQNLDAQPLNQWVSG